MFYTPSRYAFKLTTHAHGFDSKGTHLGVSLSLRCGDYDAHVKWPCHKSYRLTLVAPSDSKAADVRQTLDFSTAPASSNGRNPTLTWGFNSFLVNTALGDYLREDSLVFTIRELSLRELMRIM